MLVIIVDDLEKWGIYFLSGVFKQLEFCKNSCCRAGWVSCKLTDPGYLQTLLYGLELIFAPCRGGRIANVLLYNIFCNGTSIRHQKYKRDIKNAARTA